MFDSLQDKLESAFKNLKGQGRITDINIAATLKEIRRALVDADVNYKIAKEFTDKVKEQAMGEKVINAISPGQLMTKIVKDELVNLMGTSAWYAPGAAAAQMAMSILKDEKRIFPCCVRLNGQYKLKDIFVGAPVKLGKRGIQEIIKLRLKKDELAMLHKSAEAVKEVADALDAMKLV